MNDLLFKDEVYKIVGAAMEVYNEKGVGFLEEVYQECLEIELETRGIPFVSQKELPLYYKGRLLKKKYRADFVCYDKIVVEIKALERLSTNEEAQILNYLKATKLEVGVLINFGARNKLEWDRKIWTPDTYVPKKTRF
jgi:GxxExxY protein